MRLTVEAFEKKIAQATLATCYLLVSEDPFFLQEARNSIWQIASTRGFSNRQVWEITTHTSWDMIKKRNSCFDLFDKSFIDLRCMQALGVEAGRELEQLIQILTAQFPAPVFVISYEQSIKKAQMQAWFQKVALISTLVIFEVPTNSQLPSWITTQLKQVGLSLTSEAMSVLIQCMEGNLPAIMQLIRKLALIYEVGTPALQLDQLQVVLEDQASFELFHLTEAVLQGDARRCLRIIKHLQVASTSQALVLGYLLRLLRTAARLHDGLDKGCPLPQLFQQYSVWKNQQTGFQSLLQRIRAEDMRTLFKLAHQADRCIKGAEPKSGWHSLSRLSLCLAGQSRLILGYYNID